MAALSSTFTDSEVNYVLKMQRKILQPHVNQTPWWVPVKTEVLPEEIEDCFYPGD